MHIIIPMSGTGKRFLDAGYTLPKPLIEADGKTIIERVIALFPGETKFTFICNSDHLRTTKMREILLRAAPAGEIVEIAPHKKGPVYAVARIFDRIADDEEVIVNYCDFAKYWDYAGFLRHTRGRKADGAIPAYKGFHPHMLGSTNYAFMRDREQWMLEIREKEPFTKDRTQEYASDGTYYFRRGDLVKKYFRKLMDADIHVKGEYYVSMVYNLLVADKLTVSIYEIQHMLQWGTPRDLEEYQAWSDYFRRIIGPLPDGAARRNSILLIPLAGKGERFRREGYTVPKPLIEVSGKPMIVQAAAYLPKAERQTFVCLDEHARAYPLEQAIRAAYPEANVVRLDAVTEGQAVTCAIGLRKADPEAELLIGACDNGMLWDGEAFRRLVEAPAVDAVVWSFRRHPSAERNPHMYGWLRTTGENDVQAVSVKVPVSMDPYNDHAIVGTFWFRKVRHFTEALRRMTDRNVRVNNEFYVDSTVNELIGMGLRVKVFPVDSYLCWGTPNDLRTYEYWQSFFHKCAWHPYRLDKDVTMNPERVGQLDRKYREFCQKHI
ncbi:MAG: NTP transferase domain-containing protein [Nitrospiraceae bacterium]|nr:NTP transferase domain-containing protein [Nitrospiraceae bacterium]